MSTGRLLAAWLAVDPFHPAGRQRLRPEVPRQRTWSEGRWQSVFRPDAEALPAQRRPLHDVLRPDKPAIA